MRHDRNQKAVTKYVQDAKRKKKKLKTVNQEFYIQQNYTSKMK